MERIQYCVLKSGLHIINRKECEDQVNRKGHITNLKREFMWKVFKIKNDINRKLQCMRGKCNEEKEIHQTSSAIPCA